jgi:G3E family GTPase
VALPGAVARTLGLVGGLALDAVLVLADAQSLRERAADRYVGETVRQQLREADLVVLNKVDLLAAAALASLHSWLPEVTGRARVLHCEQARLSASLVLGIGAWLARQPNGRGADALLVARLAAPANATFDSLSLEFGHAVHIESLAASLTAPAQGLLRAKGLMRNQAGSAQSLQLVGARVVVAASVHARPDEGRLVCIGLRGHLDAAAIRQTLHASAC